MSSIVANRDAKAIQLQNIYRDFIDGSHILHYHGILDAYGHMSVRHPHDPSLFLMAQSIAPGTIASPANIVTYKISDASPLDPKAPLGYRERYIHSELLKRFPKLNAVIHSHSEAVVPYGICGVEMKPCYHMAGFLGDQVPIWDIDEGYQKYSIKEEERDMLVNNLELGTLLSHSYGPEGELPTHPVVIMRGHGVTITGRSIQECVSRSIYTQKNAGIQTTALTLNNIAGKGKPIHYLSRAEMQSTGGMINDTTDRPWGMWKREVEASNLYLNMA